jgi:hypothetical protein
MAASLSPEGNFPSYTISEIGIFHRFFLSQQYQHEKHGIYKYFNVNSSLKN